MAAETSMPTTLPELKTTAFPSNGQLLVEETDELLKVSLAAIRTEIAATPAWSGAPTPTDDFLLMFLRAEVFSPEKAAARYRKFWEVKVELCGEDKASIPIKAEDVKEALSKKFLQMIPGAKDLEGRQVMLANPGNTDKTLDRKLRVLAVWYVLLVALEDVQTQRRGMCFVSNVKTARLSHVDTKFDKIMAASIQGALPVRVGSINICFPPTFFGMLWQIVRLFLSKVKKRVKVFSGSEERVRENLHRIVTDENLPAPLGTRELCFQEWIDERLRVEA